MIHVDVCLFIPTPYDYVYVLDLQGSFIMTL